MTEHRPGLHLSRVADVPGARHIDSATTKAAVIRAIHRAVDAPDWAAPNLDALADVLRDLSWLPAGPVVLVWPRPAVRDADAIVDVVREVAAESEGSDRPLTVYLVVE
jgi:RNAse (barnase) inhibitor barstar